MKKLILIIFALATINQVHASYRDEPIRRGIGGAATGALVGGLVGGGRGAGIGAGVGFGAGLLSGAAAERSYERNYEPGYYNERYPLSNEPYYEDRGPAYIGVGLPFLMDIESAVEMGEYYPKNRNYLSPVLQKPYVEYWQKEGFYPVDEYEVQVGPYGSRLPIELDIDITSPITASVETTTQAVTAPIRTVTQPVIQTTATIVEPIAQTTAELTEPVVEEINEDILEPAEQITEDAIESTENVVAPAVETAEEVVTAPLRMF